MRGAALAFVGRCLVASLLVHSFLDYFVVLSTPAVPPGSTGFDNAIRGWVVAHQHPGLVTFFVAVSTIGGTHNMYALAVLGSVVLWFRGARPASVIVLASTALAIGLFEIVKRVVARHRPPGLGRAVEAAYSFPSAHSTASAAVCCVLAYICWREGLVRGAVAAIAAVAVPLTIGVSRVYIDAHWTTDVLAGWTAGALIAAGGAMVYQRFQRRSEGVIA